MAAPGKHGRRPTSTSATRDKGATNNPLSNSRRTRAPHSQGTHAGLRNRRRPAGASWEPSCPAPACTWSRRRFASPRETTASSPGGPPTRTCATTQGEVPAPRVVFLRPQEAGRALPATRGARPHEGAPRPAGGSCRLVPGHPTGARPHGRGRAASNRRRNPRPENDPAPRRELSPVLNGGSRRVVRAPSGSPRRFRGTSRSAENDNNPKALSAFPRWLGCVPPVGHGSQGDPAARNRSSAREACPTPGPLRPLPSRLGE